MVIKTNATSFGAGSTNVINGAIATVVTFSPVPEPGFYGLIGAGLAGLLYAARRRKRSA
jgi:hypothetical protein